MFIFRQLFDQQSSTYTYLLGDSESAQAVLIDTVFEQSQRDIALLKELELTLVATLETHIHADHITGAWLMREAQGSDIALARDSNAEGADRYLTEGDRIAFGQRFLEVLATPGHTNGCLTFVLDDHSMAFTGDAILIRGCGRTDFQQGSSKSLYHSVRNKIFNLVDQCLLYPGHDYRGLTVTSVREEKLFNPRLGGNISENDYFGYMANLDIPHPKKIDEAVPANLRCGKPDKEHPLTDQQPWATLRFSFAGIWEIEPAMLEQLNCAYQLVDVRSQAEFDGPLGKINQAQLIPLDQLSERSGELDSEIPVIMVCRSGARSAQGLLLLQKQGFKKIANLAGGMLRWRAEGFKTESGLL
ncbi:MAG: MBL fold metallo-hydrolase [Gammaproteobacteria bacterium]|jgi:sulfur dioxygenase|nr:MBL fold metallo-hydrolase [Gammaproteobacteria bacterium]MBT5202417.1 MBL fold metallo-hydrolase [Gammaproteobacteria bacterium]MBT5601542.1 MBL fold metallo-hydrolase [Gammaproteobacteria bacterium]MBT6246678.1 MBL fold metallo-hydrolase [Gammaproteobacteria bacterium]